MGQQVVWGHVHVGMCDVLKSGLLTFRHYAIRLDGCGLELETRLRKSFQLFLQTLMNMIMTGKRKKLE